MNTVETKVYPHDGTTMDYFGYATAIYHNTAVVGAYGCKDDGENSGAVYVYATNATSFPYYENGTTPWFLQQKLTPATVTERCNDKGKCEYIKEGHFENSEFGYAVGVWNKTLIVGAHRHSDGAAEGGAAFVYRRYGGQWTQHQKLTADLGHDYHYFGVAVAIWDTTAFLGASGDNHEGTAAGAVFVYDYQKSYDAWFQTTKLTASNAAAFDNFGSAIAAYKTSLIVGAYGDSTLGSMAGSAHVFSYSGAWAHAAQLFASDGEEGQYFGHAVAMYEANVVIGAFQAHGHWDNAGAAYVFRRGSDGLFYEQNKVIAHDGMTGDYFGWSVALYKNTAVIGAYGEQGKEQHDEPPHRRLQPGGEGQGPEEGHNCGPNSPPDCEQFEGHYSYRGASAGAAYVFANSGSTWLQEYKLLPNGSAAYDAFGKSVAIHENVIFVGADMADGILENTGAAYIYAPPTMSPTKKKPSSSGFLEITGSVELDALLLVCLIVIPAAIGSVWYYTNFKKNRMTADRMPVSTDSQHGSVAPWSMHGAFEDSSRGARPAATRSPLRGPPVAR